MNVAAILNVKGRDVVTASPDTSLLEVAGILSGRKIGCVVIVGADGKIAGIVSERDVVRTLAKSGADALRETVNSFMTKDVVTCRESDTIGAIMADMTARRFRHVPVVDRGALLGLVSIGDVVKMRIADAELEAAAMRDYIATG